MDDESRQIHPDGLDRVRGWVRTVKRLCDENCNECSLMIHNPSNRMLTFILNEAVEKFGEEFNGFMNYYCPNLTVCVECRVDDFVHVEGCSISQFIEKGEDET